MNIKRRFPTNPPNVTVYLNTMSSREDILRHFWTGHSVHTSVKLSDIKCPGSFFWSFGCYTVSRCCPPKHRDKTCLTWCEHRDVNQTGPAWSLRHVRLNRFAVKGSQRRSCRWVIRLRRCLSRASCFSPRDRSAFMIKAESNSRLIVSAEPSDFSSIVLAGDHSEGFSRSHLKNDGETSKIWLVYICYGFSIFCKKWMQVCVCYFHPRSDLCVCVCVWGWVIPVAGTCRKCVKMFLVPWGKFSSLERNCS